MCSNGRPRTTGLRLGRVYLREAAVKLLRPLRGWRQSTKGEPSKPLRQLLTDCYMELAALHKTVSDDGDIIDETELLERLRNAGALTATVAPRHLAPQK